MVSFEKTKLWNLGLSDRPNDPHKPLRDKLRSAYLDARTRAGHLTTEIPRVLPSLTVHDLTHIDALWEMSDLLIGDDLLSQATSFITPAEVFVLGMSFLVHDLAHSRSAIKMSDQELRRTTEYRDILAAILTTHVDRVPSDNELEEVGDKLHEQALAQYLRSNHAKLSAQLLTTSWLDNGSHHFLVQDDEVRSAYGELVGKIAASHWHATRDLRLGFSSTLGAPGWLPQEWTCDPLKLACILRCADAMHLDSRRAPIFLRAIRRPEQDSNSHWEFQGRLLQPSRNHDRLVFTSSSSFPMAHAAAWWMCFDVLSSVSRELREVDLVLAEQGLPRFAVRSVAGVEDSRLFAKYIQTDGWLPVDARIEVSDVTSLVARLGGAELYGNNPTVPLRELIQNGSDAISAKQRLLGLPADSGSVRLLLREESGVWILEVEDSGVGMSEGVLGGSLLDFGKSFWNSSDARTAFPGLASSGFTSTGRYGIGFFSVFMVADKVEVTSRRYDAAAHETKVLVLSDGVRSRPLLRPAERSEYLYEGGTRLRLWLKSDPHLRGGFLAGDIRYFPELPFDELIAWLCPSSPVTIFTSVRSEALRQVVKANDWLSIGARELLERVVKPYGGWYSTRVAKEIEENHTRVRDVVDERGQKLGRGCILTSYGPYLSYSNGGSITVGGFRSEDIPSVGGVILGSTTRAARDSAMPLCSSKSLSKWATEQGELIRQAYSDPVTLSRAAASVRGLLGRISGLPIALARGGWMTAEMIEPYAVGVQEILLLDESDYRDATKNRDIILSPYVLVCEYSYSSTRTQGAEPWLWHGSDQYFWTLSGAVIEAIALGWRTSLEQVLDVSTPFDTEADDKREVAVTSGGERVMRPVAIIRRPMT